jgi:hypothetical protein
MIDALVSKSRITGALKFATKGAIWLFVVGLLFKPAITAQPAGDDLINPFYMFFETNGSFFESFKLGIEYGTSHKFDILGQIAFVTHSWLWIQFDYFTGLDHTWFYALSKGMIFAVVLLSATYWLQQIIWSLRLQISSWKLLFLVTAFSGSTVQMHNIWSNDPVANYPMSGYASAVFSFVVLGLLVRHKNSQSLKTMFLVSTWVSVAILYYQINISLLPAVLMFWLANSWLNLKDKNLLQPILRGTALFLMPVVVVLYGTFLTSGKTDDYGGTTIGSWSTFPKTTVIGILGTLPGGGWNLSEKSIGAIFFPGWTTALVGVILLWILISLVPPKATDKSNSFDWKEAFKILLPGVAFWLAVVSIQTMTSKYQNEIVSVGQIYNFYSHGHIFIAGVVLIVFLGLSRISNRWTTVAICIIVFFGVTQFQINSQLKTVMRDGNSQSLKLLDSFDVSTSDKSRCEAWKNWASIGWPEYYETGMSVGYQQAFKTLYGKEFCSSGTDPIP